MKTSWLLLMFTSLVQAGPLGSDLQGLLDYAKQHNPELAAMRYEADAAALRVQPAGSLPDPVLRTEMMDITNQGTPKPVSLLPSKVGGTRYLLMQTLPWFGKLDLQSGIAQAQVDAARGQTELGWADLSSKIKSAYAMHYSLTDSIRLTRQTQDLSRNLEQVARTRYANGIGSQQEVIRAQLEQSDLRMTLIELENEQHHVHSRINTLLSRPAQAELAEPVALRPAALDVAALEDKLRAHNPQLQVGNSRITEAQRNRDLTYNNRYPGLTLGIAPTQSGNTVKSWDLMLELNLPLQQESRRSQERESEAKLAASAARQESLQSQLLAELSENISAFESATRTDEALNSRLLPQAQLSFQSAMNGYTTGKVDFATVLEAHRQVLKIRSQSIKVRYEQQFRLAEIDRLTGEQ